MFIDTRKMTNGVKKISKVHDCKYFFFLNQISLYIKVAKLSVRSKTSSYIFLRQKMSLNRTFVVRTFLKHNREFLFKSNRMSAIGVVENILFSRKFIG